MLDVQERFQLLGPCAHAGYVLHDHPQDRDVVIPSLCEEPECGAQGCDAELVDAYGPVQGVGGNLPDEPGLTQDDACLRSAQDLIAAEGEHIGKFKATRYGPLVRDAVGGKIEGNARAHVYIERDAELPGQAGDLADLNLVGESHDGEVAPVHLDDEPGIVRDGRAVVGEPGLVGGAHLAHYGPACS